MSGFGLHPALLDAALHAGRAAGGPGDGRRAWLPFAWAGCRLHAAGARCCGCGSARTGRRRAAAGRWPTRRARWWSSVASLVLRPLPAAAGGAGAARRCGRLVPGGLGAGRAAGRCGTVGGRWAVLARSAERVRRRRPGSPGWRGSRGDHGGRGRRWPRRRPDVVSCRGCPAARGAAGDAACGAARAAARELLGLVQEWLGEERLGGSRLVVVTRGAVAAGPGGGRGDLAAARCGGWCGRRRRRTRAGSCWRMSMTVAGCGGAAGGGRRARASRSSRSAAGGCWCRGWPGPGSRAARPVRRPV